MEHDIFAGLKFLLKNAFTSGGNMKQPMLQRHDDENPKIIYLCIYISSFFTIGKFDDSELCFTKFTYYILSSFKNTTNLKFYSNKNSKGN